MDRLVQTKLNGHILRRIFATAFCIFIAVTVVYVMTNVYSPNMNAIGALCSVCMDILCMIILFIIIGSIAFGRYESTRTTRIFGFLLLATIWAIFLDFLNWAFDGSLQFGHLTFWFTLGSLCMGSILACIFILYLYSYMAATHRLIKTRKITIICAALNLFSFVLTFFLAITGTAFQFVDGHYEIGALYDVVTIIPILTVLIISGFIVRYIKIVGAHDALSAAGYIIFMVVGALIESAYRIGTTYVAVAIADIFIFVMLQNEIIALEKKKVQKWMKESHTDELTRLYNRHAYEADMEKLEKGIIPDDFVYISVDVNSLKMTNDANGHYAGDELLVGAAECLDKCFGEFGKLYRTGGDEFIGLMNMDEAHINAIQSRLLEETNKWHGNLVEKLTVSCGFVTRAEAKDMSLRDIAELADKRMYEEKDKYYHRPESDRRTGVERRSGGDRRKR